MENDQILQKNLKTIEHGASGLRIFSAIFGVLAKAFSVHGSDRMLECPRHAWGSAGSTRITGQRRR